MQLNPSEISELIKSRIQNLDAGAQMRTQGTVVSVTDGICRIHGLSDVMQGEMLEFPKNTFGLALNLERDSVGAVILGEYQRHHRGRHGQDHRQDPVGADRPGAPRARGQFARPADRRQGPDQRQGDRRHREGRSGVVVEKVGVQPVQTGLKAIDSMVPVGRGQRELIIGDRQTGKTAVAVDTIINQKGKDLFCVYVAIGQKASTIANVVLEEHGAMAYTIIVASPASESAAMQYIAPYSGCTMGEYFRDRGQDALIIYDDLTKQAWAYRQVSLLLRRPPGREAYPGDVFYLHSRLLERGARVNEAWVERFTNGKVKGKTGSLTALPIIETQGRRDRVRADQRDLDHRTARSFSRPTSSTQASARHQRRHLGVAGGRRRADQDHEAQGHRRRRAPRARAPRARRLRAVRLRPRPGDAQAARPRPRRHRAHEAAAVPAAAGVGNGADAVRGEQRLLRRRRRQEGARRREVDARLHQGKYGALVKTMEEKKDLSADDEKALKAAIEDWKKNATSNHARYQGIRMKIRSVQNTRKITKAMEMVAASKMRKAQERMRQARPYGEKIRNVAAHISHANPEYRHPFLVDRDSVKRVGIIVVTTDKGLCGALNTNLLRVVVASTSVAGAGRGDRRLRARRQGPGFHAAAGANIVSQAVQLGDYPHMDRLIGALKVMLDGYMSDRFDRLMIAYNRFFNTMQEPVLEQLLPLGRAARRARDGVGLHLRARGARGARPGHDALHRGAHLPGGGREHGLRAVRRMVAMKAASDNADTLIDELTLIYNKNRQAGITKEISECRRRGRRLRKEPWQKLRHPEP